MTRAHRLSAFFYGAMGALSVALVVGVLALAGVFGGEDEEEAADTAAPAARADATPAPESPGDARGAPTSVAALYARVSSGVVFVSARGGNGSLRFEGPGGGQAASGSGFLIDDRGSIVTNQHVVDDATDVRVRFGEEGSPIRARIAGADASSDLALLKIDPDDVGGDIRPLALGSSKALRPGDPAIAIGSPFGLSGTVTAGIVSALDRPIPSPNGFTIAGAVQTDAAINPGNSGGPLLDDQGRVIGVNAQIRTSGSGSNSGVGFAVPVDTVKDVIPQLERDGRVVRGFLGLSTGESEPVNRGAVVGAADAGTPAAEGGIRRGDLIVEVDGDPVRDPDDVALAIDDRKPGERVRVVVVRGGDRRTLTVELGTRPAEATP